jgi:molybdopterin molybdotransferase
MDGYAIPANDPSPKFRVVAQIQAGAAPQRPLRPGECARILTGAPVPGASRVLMQEHTRIEGGFMVPLKPETATNVRRHGEDARKGDLLLSSGTRLGPGDLALLAANGIVLPKVSPLVRVAHFATGNELVGPEEKAGPGLIRDSNSTLVAALTARLGGQMVRQERVRDDFDRLLKKARAITASCDLLLLSGGAGAGEYDFGQRLLSALGFGIHFTAVNLRPGKPLLFATRGRQAAFVLPGNPISHLVTLHLAVRAAFERFAGLAPAWPAVRVRLAESFIHRPTDRQTAWPARLKILAGSGELVAHALPWQSSGDVTGLAGVNALLILEAGAAAPAPGGFVSVLMLEVP